ncbi:hypothetical protein PIB30_014801 [Stylosanthes scabra]|uniref:Uncharacterized protein n=1 Tax=Stylosanthes scabra TaxID=79078 RepID=A0ABU6Q7F1_9FABA|nr:hypothetical protein [Stylosanthes scabra]
MDPIMSHSAIYNYIICEFHASYMLMNLLFLCQEKAKKNKKKMPLKPDVRVKQPKERARVEEIQISQNAPYAEEGNSLQGIGQHVKFQSSSSHDLQARMKLPITRPQNPPITTTLGDNIQSIHGNGPSGVSAETIAATSSGTAARLFKFMPTPGFKPPR